MRKLLLGLFTSLLVSSLAFAAEDVIRIGVYNSLSGQNAYGGRMELEGIKLAHAEYPEMLGKKIELFIADNESDRAKAAEAVTNLIEKDKVHVIIGTYGSSLAISGGNIAEKKKIPVMGTSCTHPSVTRGKKYYFRACFVDSFQGAGAASYAYNTLGHTKAAVLTDSSNHYSKGLSKYFKDSFKKLGGTIVAEASYKSGDDNFRTQLSQIMAQQPEIVFMPSYFTEGVLILKQAKELNAPFKFIGADAMDNPEASAQDKQAMEGFLYTTFAYDPSDQNMNPVAKKFTQDWRKAHPGTEPSVNAALGYDSYLLVISAIKRAGSFEPEKIRIALETTRNIPTVTGLTTLNSSHDAEKELGIMGIDNGTRRFIGIITP